MHQSHMADREAWLATRAYLIWEMEGRPDGRALINWLQAEEDLCEAERQALEQSTKRAKKHTAAQHAGCHETASTSPAAT